MHLFIVNERTLRQHLKYSFVGVTKNKDFDWKSVKVHHAVERAQAGMYADISRVHQGDEVLLYLEKTHNDKSREGGRFIGIFEIISDQLFYEPKGKYLLEDLKIPLIYRLLIKPKTIYANGVSEWQAMDEMTDFGGVHDIPWTIIYRKMTGRRGCTPLLPHESEIIKKMLQTNNYQDVRERLYYLMNRTRRKWESHLQAYLMQELKRNEMLTKELFPQTKITWIGNEIYAGAGMQRIDVLVYSKNKYNEFIHLIELKSVPADASAASQVNRYIRWLKAHIPGVSVNQIIPTIIAPSILKEYHDELKIYLKGLNISQYRTVTIDRELLFNLEIFNI